MTPYRLTYVLIVLALVACAAPPPPAPTPQAEAPPSSAPVRTATLQHPSPTQPIALTATGAAPAPTLEPALARLFDDRRLTYEPDFYALEIQAFLDGQPGPLKGIIMPVGDRQHTFAEALTSQAIYYSVNPKIILALIELQSRLISDPQPTADQFAWAVGFRGENGRRRGLQAQVRWAVKELLYARRDYPQRAALTFADGSTASLPEGMSLAEYALARVLAPTTTPERLPALMEQFRATYTRLFDDPRIPPTDWFPLSPPFLTRPIRKVVPTTSFFDHGGPFLTRNSKQGVTTYWGRVETDPIFAYNGHDGWDYAAAPPERALAAADGVVVFAGNADDGCATRAVVIDHKNGYRTLYWHLHRVDVAIGAWVVRGQPIGVIGNTGCSSGPHLHFGVQYLGRNTDPYGWCGAGNDPWQTHPAGTVSRWLWMDRPSPCAPPPEGGVAVDAGLPGFFTDGEGWKRAPTGYGGESLLAASVRGAGGRPWKVRSINPPSLAIWRAELPTAGRYRVIAFIPYAVSRLRDATQARYLVQHAEGMAEVVVDAATHANDWAELGTYPFDNTGAEVVLTSAAEEGMLSVWADVVMWLPIPTEE
ncbi:MAG: peptidoglycan DD-metalloendopeptidase family protein [Roseiflexus sp.]|nr:peptidoglycan DD-metalloendopeptidase family protein [Roseiflexus sp.]MCS7289383.1 peptidoglycan DD-metalloendopeptidase family protein [Roseiflexus sp.]MDW8145094.1 peptidoglycan DD-metalloendopeptidase family protein [Roseiflexaceae bacterium]MDW8233300.1 peptidoglycan DD-metalloendopeptidase family protein [Roseiflexaceae bacterium]